MFVEVVQVLDKEEILQNDFNYNKNLHRNRWYRIIKHRNVEDCSKTISGLIESIYYRLRIRCHNIHGLSKFSTWSDSIAPKIGIDIIEINQKLSSVKLIWFKPLIITTETRYVSSFELQICNLKGPNTKSILLSNFIPSKLAKHQQQLRRKQLGYSDDASSNASDKVTKNGRFRSIA